MFISVTINQDRDNNQRIDFAELLFERDRVAGADGKTVKEGDEVKREREREEAEQRASLRNGV